MIPPASTANRILFMGLGPKGAALDTPRASEILASHPLIVIDSDLDPEILDDVRSTVGKVESLDEANGYSPLGASQIVHAIGEASTIAAFLIEEVRQGHSVLRLTADDPLTNDAVVAEIDIIAHSTLEGGARDVGARDVGALESAASKGATLEDCLSGSKPIPYDIMPTASAAPVAASYAGVALGSQYGVVDIRGGAQTQLTNLAKIGISLAIRARSTDLPRLSEELLLAGMVSTTPVAVILRATTHCQHTLETTVEKMVADYANHTDSVGREDCEDRVDSVGRGDSSESHGDFGNYHDDLTVVIGRSLGENRQYSSWGTRPLIGMRVLIPRAKEQSRIMTQRLSDYGAIADAVPTISIQPPQSSGPLEEAVAALLTGSFGWIVFTSTNAVRAVWKTLGTLGLDSRAFSRVKVACVGATTAQALEHHGILYDLVPPRDHSSRGLVDIFPVYESGSDSAPGVLLPRADIATETLPMGLIAKGWDILEVTAYQTLKADPPTPETRRMITTGRFDAICFTSPSTVRNLVEIAGMPPSQTIIACIGWRTAQQAQKGGFPVAVQPEKATATALVDALAEYVTEHRLERLSP